MSGFAVPSGSLPHLVVPDDRGGIAHAQLTLGNGMIMLGSVRPPEEYDGLVKTPEEAGINTQAPYIVIEEIDDHYRRAVAAGADIVYEIADQDYGGSVCTPPGTLRDTCGTSAPITHGPRAGLISTFGG